MWHLFKECQWSRLRTMGREQDLSYVWINVASDTGKLTALRTLGGHRSYQESEVRNLRGGEGRLLTRCRDPAQAR